MTALGGKRFWRLGGFERQRATSGRLQRWRAALGHNSVRQRSASSEAAERRSMDRNLSGFLIGCVGAAVTLLAYEQTLVSSTQCVVAGFIVLLFALFVKEGFISL
ncbi:hypothetical protein GUJ93_ZPchr0004g40407 [Zizania palustris]|uniref:Uncharacterized protein n=1 Tax=Zizania palustris TaxID=103762 RepID=A0A8J5S5U7_ZIZPA|nr:hypothetical protein GUJ93_ZPchr0004g40407 [Zizania palustris]